MGRFVTTVLATALPSCCSGTPRARCGPRSSLLMESPGLAGRHGSRRPSSLVVNATTRHLLVMGSIPNWANTSAKRTLRPRVQFLEHPRPGNVWACAGQWFLYTLHLRLPDGRPILFWVLVLVGACQSGTVWAGLCLIHHHHGQWFLPGRGCRRNV